MRKVLLVLAAVVASAVMPAAALAEADTSTVSLRIPIEMVTGNSCQVEGVAISGYVHVVQHVTSDDTGGVHIANIVNLQGVAGTGLVSGFQYRLSNVQIEFVSNFAGLGAQEQTEIAVGQFVARGRGDDLALHANIHFTINANGDLTVLFANQTQECR